MNFVSFKRSSSFYLWLIQVGKLNKIEALIFNEGWNKVWEHIQWIAIIS